MYEFSYEELSMIHIALQTELIKMECNSEGHSKRHERFEKLYAKMFDIKTKQRLKELEELED